LPAHAERVRLDAAACDGMLARARLHVHQHALQELLHFAARQLQQLDIAAADVPNDVLPEPHLRAASHWGTRASWRGRVTISSPM
jgi:hypothetical protein